MRWERWRGKNK